MPRRTNEKQEIIALLRRNLARDGCTITDSKLLKDCVTGLEREVDVVMECPEGDRSLIVSFEVLAHARPADVTWVEQQQKKHEHLPTNQLVLISWSGFTSSAIQQAKTDPRVQLITPEVVSGPDGAQAVTSVFAEKLGISVKQVVLLVAVPGAGTQRVQAFPYTTVFDVSENELGTAQDLVDIFIRSREVGERLLRGIHDHPDRDEIKWFVIGAQRSEEDAKTSVRKEPENAFHRIVGIEVAGPVMWQQQKVDLAVAKFGQVVFGHGETSLWGRQTRMVATLGDGDDIKRVTVRVYKETDVPKVG